MQFYNRVSKPGFASGEKKKEKMERALKKNARRAQFQGKGKKKGKEKKVISLLSKSSMKGGPGSSKEERKNRLVFSGQLSG